jgi:hypothetical protein
LPGLVSHGNGAGGKVPGRAAQADFIAGTRPFDFERSTVQTEKTQFVLRPGRFFLRSQIWISILAGMRRLAVLSILLATVIPASAEDWTTADGKTYKNVTILYQEADGVRVTYDGGAGKLPYYELPLGVQKRLGEDVDTLQAKKKAADLALAQRNAALAAKKKTEADAAVKVAEKQFAAASEKVDKPVIVPVAPPPPVHYNPPAPPDPYPGAKYSYNASLDSSFLDSYPVALNADSSVSNPAIGSVVLQIVTDGRKPEIPSQMEAIFLSAASPDKVSDNHDAVLSVDGNHTTLPAREEKDGSFIAQSGMGYVAFDISPDQARSIMGKNVEFVSGGTTYKIDPSGLSDIRKYFSNVDQLPPAPSSFFKIFHRFLASLPPITTMISEVCEYVILIAFAVVVTAFIAAFAIGAVRFLKI